MPSESQPPEGDPEELEFTLTWRAKEDFLVGDLVAMNTTSTWFRKVDM